jgi:outer membrane protein TolC
MKRLLPALLAVTCFAQVSHLVKPYQAPAIPPVRLNNSDRIGGLIRAGKLYLSLRDAIALAIENNLDLEIDRYGPLLAASAVKRAEAGGPYRGVPSGATQISSVDSGLGVAGSIQAAGLGSGGGNGGGGNGGAASIQQVGQVTPNLDPVLTNSTAFSHITQPQVNTLLSQTSALVQSKHTYTTVLQQGLYTGGTLTVTDYEQSVKENAPSDVLNPALAPFITVSLSHNLLQGFGIQLNNRDIRISKLNAIGSQETFRSQLLDLVANVQNVYWDVVAANDTVKARESAVAIAQKFRDDTKSEIELGALARVQLPGAEAELAQRQQDLTIAIANVRSQEIRLKEALSRREDPLFDEMAIVPLDRIEVPATDDIPPLRKLVETAMAKRPDVRVGEIRDKTQQMSSAGTATLLLPSLTVGGSMTDRSAAGTPQASSGEAPNAFFVGGYGTALGQIFRRNFPSESGRVSISLPIGNRSAQADYGIDQLSIRQAEVQGQRDNNQIVVELSNQSIGLRQARARYATAVEARTLQEQLLKAEQQKFAFGQTKTTGALIAAQRALVAAQTGEVNALTAYAHARVSLDQVLGQTLETNHVSVDEALAGRVSQTR